MSSSSSSPEKSALSSLSDRLRAAPSHLSRLLSPKLESLKSLLSTPTPESRFVDQATSSTSPDWGLNLRICSLINSNDLNGPEIVRSIKKKIAAAGTVPVAARLGLELLEVTAMNCEKVVSEIAAEKVLEEMVRVVGTGEEGVEREVRVRVLEMVRAWGESRDLEYLPVFRQTYENLLQRGLYSNADDDTHYTLDSYIGQEPISPPENYPIPDTEANVGSGTNLGSLSVEQRKEFLEITRNSIEVLSSLLSSEDKPDFTKDDLMMSMLERCRDSQPVLQRLVETTTDDEAILSEALSLHDELEQVISKFEKLEVSGEPKHGSVDSNSTSMPSLSAAEVEGSDIEVLKGSDSNDAGTYVSDPMVGGGCSGGHSK